MAYSAGQELSSLAFDKIIGGALDAVITAQSNASMTTVNFIKNAGFLLDDKGNVKEPIYVGFKYPKEVVPYIPAKEEYFAIEVVSGGKGYRLDNITEISIKGTPVKIDFTFTTEGNIASAKFQEKPSATLDDKTEITLKTSIEEGIEKAVLKAVKIAAVSATPAVYQNMEINVPILTMLPVPFIRVQTTDIEFNVKINSLNTSNESTDTTTTAGSNSDVGYKGFGASVKVNINASISSQKKTSSTEEIKKEFSLNIKVHAVQDEMPAGISRILDILEESIVPQISSAPTAKAIA